MAATDTLVEGRHFLAGTPANAIGHQALAVNLSDLAAMGAEPAWALLSLSMPRSDERWLADFADGLYELAERHGVALVGGDTVSGPLVVTIEVLGFVPPAQALRRSGASAGDLIIVSGAPGVAAAGLEELHSGRATFESKDARVRRFLRAEPRLALGRALRGFATAAMDVSDGLLGDLGKLARASGVGASIDLERLPVAPELAAIRWPSRNAWCCTGVTTTNCCSPCPPITSGASAPRQCRWLQPAVHRLDGAGRGSSAVATARA